MPRHDSYLWEAFCPPDIIVKQEIGGWRYLKAIRHCCVALIFRPQRDGFKQVNFDFRPDNGFVLEWVGWENSITFSGPSIVGHTATNKIVARQCFTVGSGGETVDKWFEFFYYILPSGDVVMGNMDFDQMSVKMKGFANASCVSQLRSGIVR